MKELGFQRKKRRSNRIVPTVKHDGRYMQFSYLTALKRIKEDEMYIHSCLNGCRNWSDHSAWSLHQF